MSLEELLGPPDDGGATAGHWRAIQFAADAASGERYNIGIVITPADGPPVMQLANDMARYRCAFGDQITSHIGHCLALARDTLGRPDSEAGTDLAHPHLRLTDPVPVHSTDLQATAHHLLHALAPMARPTAQLDRKGRIGQPTKQLRRNVADIIRKRLGTRAEQVLAQNTTLKAAEGDHRWALDVPLQAKAGFGSMISAQLRDASRISSNVHSAVFDLQVAADLHNKTNVGLFMLRPPEGAMANDKMEQVDAAIDTLVRGLRHQHVHAVADLTTDQMANSVIEWSGV